MHGQRKGNAQRLCDQHARVSVARKHVRMHDIKGFFLVQPLCNRQRRSSQQPAAEVLFALVAQRQAARIIDLGAVDHSVLRRSRVNLVELRAKPFHHRQHAHAGDDHNLVAARHQRLRLLVHIEAIGRIVRLPVDHHQNAKLLFHQHAPPFPSACGREPHPSASADTFSGELV